MLRWCGQGITTLSLPVRELALVTTDHLFRKVNDARRKSEAPCKVMLLSTLVPRSSTAAPPADAARQRSRPDPALVLASK
jgi:LacI family transcriptional regulator